MTDKTDLILFSVGVLVGGFFIYVIMQRNTQTSPTLHLSPSTESSYKNDEKWELTRDNNGIINSLNIIRDAKTKTL